MEDPTPPDAPPAAEDPLTAETLKLNQVLQAAEAWLVARRYAVEAEVPLTSETPRSALVFGRTAARWGLTVRAPDGTATPLLNTARSTRAAAAYALEDLYAAIQAARVAQIAHVRDATEIAHLSLATWQDLADGVRTPDEDA